MALLPNEQLLQCATTMERLRFLFARSQQAKDSLRWETTAHGEDKALADLMAAEAAIVESLVALYKMQAPPTCKPNWLCVNCYQQFYIDKLEFIPGNPHVCPACGSPTLGPLSEVLPEPPAEDKSAF